MANTRNPWGPSDWTGQTGSPGYDFTGGGGSQDSGQTDPYGGVTTPSPASDPLHAGIFASSPGNFMQQGGNGGGFTNFAQYLYANQGGSTLGLAGQQGNTTGAHALDAGVQNAYQPGNPISYLGNEARSNYTGSLTPPPPKPTPDPAAGDPTKQGFSKKLAGGY